MSVAEAAVIDEGDLVKVRREDEPSIVVLPTDRPSDCLPDGVPDVNVCCVPIALVRTPVEGGVLRWVELGDLTLVETLDSADTPRAPQSEA